MASDRNTQAGERGRRSRRPTGRIRRRLRLDAAVKAGDVALGVGVLAAGPAVRATRRWVAGATTVTTSASGAAYALVPETTRESLAERTSELARSGREARTDALEGVVSTVVAEVLSSEAVRSALATVVEGVVDEVKPSAVPNPVRLPADLASINLDEALRSSLERVLPQVLERDLTEAVIHAASLPARTARGLVRLPGGRSALIRRNPAE